MAVQTSLLPQVPRRRSKPAGIPLPSFKLLEHSDPFVVAAFAKSPRHRPAASTSPRLCFHDPDRMPDPVQAPSAPPHLVRIAGIASESTAATPSTSLCPSSLAALLLCFDRAEEDEQRPCPLTASLESALLCSRATSALQAQPQAPRPSFLLHPPGQSPWVRSPSTSCCFFPFPRCWACPRFGPRHVFFFVLLICPFIQRLQFFRKPL